MARNVTEYRDLSVDFIKRASAKTADTGVRRKLAQMAVLVSVGRPLIESAKRAGYDDLTAHLLARQICHGVKQAFGRWGPRNGPIRQGIRNLRGGGGGGMGAQPQAAPQVAPQAAPQAAPAPQPAQRSAAGSLALQMAGGAARGSRNAQPSQQFSDADIASLAPSRPSPQFSDADIDSLAPSKPTGPSAQALGSQMGGSAARGMAGSAAAGGPAAMPSPAAPQVANKPMTRPGVPPTAPPAGGGYNPSTPAGPGQQLGRRVGQTVDDAYVGVGNAANQASDWASQQAAKARQSVGNAYAGIGNMARGAMGGLGAFLTGGTPDGLSQPSAPTPAQAPAPVARHPAPGMSMGRYNTPR